MRKSSRPLGLLAAALLVSGCTSSPTAPEDGAATALAGLTPDTSRLIGVDAGSLARPGDAGAPALQLGEIRGRLLAPPGMVAAGGMNMVAAGGLNLAPATGGMVAAGGLNEGPAGRAGAYVLLATEPAARGVAGAEVAALDPDGRPLPGVAPAATDGDGRFRLQGVPVGTPVVLVARLATRAGAARTFEALVRLDAPEGEAEISVASTVAVAAARRRGPLAAVPPAGVAAAQEIARAALPEARAAEVAEAGAWDEAAAAIMAATPVVGEALAPRASARPSAPPTPGASRDDDRRGEGRRGDAKVAGREGPKADRDESTSGKHDPSSGHDHSGSGHDEPNSGEAEPKAAKEGTKAGKDELKGMAKADDRPAKADKSEAKEDKAEQKEDKAEKPASKEEKAEKASRDDQDDKPGKDEGKGGKGKRDA